jgi:hypothetical protein
VKRQSRSRRTVRAAVIIARRSLEAVTVEKGEQEGILAERLKSLQRRSAATYTFQMGQGGSLDGNVGAALRRKETVSREDVQQLLRPGTAAFGVRAASRASAAPNSHGEARAMRYTAAALWSNSR